MPAKRYITFFLIALFALQLFQIFYLKRSFFLGKYNLEYWKDRYEHSQYTLRFSQRIIGDDGLYGYAGYRLMKGDDPFSINVDKPPVAKYLIGLSIIFLGNPAFYAIFFGLGTLLCLYLIARIIFKETVFSLFSVLILFFDPLFFSELWKPWIDLPQVFFLLCNILTILLLISNRERVFLWSLVSGLSLGLFIETKPPILFPIIFVLETIAFIILLKKFRGYIVYLLGIGIGIFVPYIRYFQLGHGFIDFVRVHKYMLSIYQQSQLPVHKSAIWKTLFIGMFPDVVTGKPTPVSQWWVMWPITILFLIVFVVLVMKKKQMYTEKGIAIFVVTSLLIFTSIPSYPRYLLLVLPFLYVIIVKMLKDLFPKIAQVILIIFIGIYGLIHAHIYLLPDPNDVLENFYYSFSHEYFQDVYQENLSVSFKKSMSQKDFRMLAQKTLDNASVKSIEIIEKQKEVSKFTDTGKAEIAVTYKTLRLGSFSQTKSIPLVKENGEWKIKWDWNILLDNYKPEDKIEVNYNLGKRGKILSHYGYVVAQDTEDGYLISVNPDKIDTKREKEILSYIGNLVGFVWEQIHNQEHENVLPNSYVPVISVFTKLDNKQMATLLSFPGVMLTKYPARVYDGVDPTSIVNTFYEQCCTKIYSAYNYHGVKGVEKQYDSILSGSDGGSIVLKDKSWAVKQVILEKQPTFGKDVQLP